MSEVDVKDAPAADVAEDAGGERSKLLHLPATLAEALYAEMGLPWRALCGRIMGPPRTTRPPGYQGPECCVVCREIRS